MEDRNMRIIKVCAPDINHSEQEVEEFYGQLQEEIDRARNNEIVMIIRNFNNRIGDDRGGYEDIMRHFGVGERNEREERMLDFCQQNQLYITNSHFYRCTQHRYTWNHPNNRNKAALTIYL